MKIQNISAVEILDSRGNPTVKAYVELENGIVTSASVPSGASTGTHEAVELRDGDVSRYMGKGVQKAVENVESIISPHLKGMSVESLQQIDEKLLELDGTENKAKLGANAILAVSLSAARACAQAQNKHLWHIIHEQYFPSISPAFPRLFANLVNGGKHADWNFDIQEFIISPLESRPSQSVRIASEIFHSLGKLLKEKNLGTLVGDEGGYSPKLSSNEEVFEYLQNAIQRAGYTTQNISIALDCAASEFFDKQNNQYILKKQNKSVSGRELIAYYLTLIEKYHVFSFEDPFFEDDWDSFVSFTSQVAPNTLVVGDDLFVTNPKRINTGIEKKAANAVLVKVNQIGSLYETVEAINLCKKNNWKTIISHRSGETEDSFIADLSYACAADYIKTGSMSRSDRLAKYNRLIEIERREL